MKVRDAIRMIEGDGWFLAMPENFEGFDVVADRSGGPDNFGDIGFVLELLLHDAGKLGRATLKIMIAADDRNAGGNDRLGIKLPGRRYCMVAQ